MGKIRKIQPATVILYLGRDVANCHVVFFLFLTLAFAMKHSSQIQRSKWAKRGGWVGISTSTDAESSSLWVSRVIKGQKTRVKWQIVCPLVMSISLLFIPCLLSIHPRAHSSVQKCTKYLGVIWLPVFPPVAKRCPITPWHQFIRPYILRIRVLNVAL